MHNRRTQLRWQTYAFAGLALAAVVAAALVAFMRPIANGNGYMAIVFLLSAVAIAALVAFLVLIQKDIKAAKAVAAALSPAPVANQAPPQWVILAVNSVSTDRLRMSTATLANSLGRGEGRFLLNPQGAQDAAVPSQVLVALDNRLTGEDTGYFLYRSPNGNHWLFVASDVQDRLAPIEGTAHMVIARLVIRNRPTPPSPTK